MILKDSEEVLCITASASTVLAFPLHGGSNHKAKVVILTAGMVSIVCQKFHVSEAWHPAIWFNIILDITGKVIFQITSPIK